jgi:hypothetical protein
LSSRVFPKITLSEDKEAGGQKKHREKQKEERRQYLKTLGRSQGRLMGASTLLWVAVSPQTKRKLKFSP